MSWEYVLPRRKSRLTVPHQTRKTDSETTVALAYTLQAAVAVPSIVAQSERFYDLSGSLTYLSCTALSLYLPTIRARYAAAAAGSIKPAWPSILGALRGVSGAGLNWRQVVLSAAVSLWATRRESKKFPFPLYHYTRAYLYPFHTHRACLGNGAKNKLRMLLQWEPTSSNASRPTAPTPASTTSGHLPRNS